MFLRGRPTIMTALFLIRVVSHIHCQIGFEQMVAGSGRKLGFPCAGPPSVT